VSHTYSHTCVSRTRDAQGENSPGSIRFASQPLWPVSRASRLRRCMYVGCNHTNQCNAGRPPGPVWVSQTTDSQGPLACGVVTITPCTVTDPVAACSRRIPFPLRYDELRAYGEHRYSERQSHAGDRGENPLTPTTHICVRRARVQRLASLMRTQTEDRSSPQITFEAVFRRNYDWGKLQQESVRTCSPPAAFPLVPHTADVVRACGLCR
jgi:hypothetical protein